MNWNSTGANGELSYHSNIQVNANFPLQDAVDYFPHNLIDQRKNDEEFFKNFVSNIKERKEIKTNYKPIKISEAKICLSEIFNAKKQVEDRICELDVNDEKFDVKSQAFLRELNEINTKILKFETDVKPPLQRALLKRLKKRKAIKERNQRWQSYKKSVKDQIEEKHKIIDKLLSERSEEVEAIKKEADLKRQADTVLHEVRRKKYEGRKMLNLLTALGKLRDLRIKEEEKRGGYCSKQLTETFNQVMARFQHLWEKQLDVYKLEEKGLKIMLQENALPHRKESKFETNLLQWEKVLFGDITNDENEKLLTLADTDIEALIQVRRDWDQFLTNDSTPMASGIPPGWILPPECEDDQWRTFTKTPHKPNPEE